MIIIDYTEVYMRIVYYTEVYMRIIDFTEDYMRMLPFNILFSRNNLLPALSVVEVFEGWLSSGR